MKAFQCEDLLFAWQNLPVVQHHIHTCDCINLKNKQLLFFFSTMMKNALIQAAGELMFSSLTTGWRHSLTHFIKHLSCCYCQLSVKFSSVEFGCPRGWSKAYSVLSIHGPWPTPPVYILSMMFYGMGYPLG
uniref:Uncharacterized protein n=1 Tax=Falco tinnunculus TaxID=100819 RepID=A0A8C4UKA6_FALTI